MFGKCKYLILIVMLGFIFSGCVVNYVAMDDIIPTEKNYPVAEEMSSLSFALAEPYVLIKTELSEVSDSGLIDRIEKNAKDIKCYLRDETNKIMVSKGITVTDIFESHGTMTFTQKRNTSALFYPSITIKIEEKSQKTVKGKNEVPLVVDGRIAIKAKVQIIMLEPLSGEIIWIKSLPIRGQNSKVHYKHQLYASARMDNGAYVPEELVGIAQKWDKMFTEIAIAIVKATEKYVVVEEFEFLSKDIEKLKELRRY